MTISSDPVWFFESERLFTIFSSLLGNDDKILKQKYPPCGRAEPAVY